MSSDPVVPPVPENGQIESGEDTVYYYGHVVRYSCNEGYQIKPASNYDNRCEADSNDIGVWSQMAITCTREYDF